MKAEKKRLEQEISALQKSIRSIKTEYQKELKIIQKETAGRTLQLERSLKKQHKAELERISAEYNRHRKKLTELLESQKREIQEKIEADTRAINDRISQIETKISTQTEKERKIADRYMARMEQEWLALCSRTELLQYISPHQPTVDYANRTAALAYQAEQYQATTAIMVNTSSLIGCWEQTAEVLYEEWRGLYELCEEIVNYLEISFNTTKEQEVICDGILSRINLRVYLPNDFIHFEEICIANREKLGNCSLMTNEEMRMFLHDLQKDQYLTDQTIHSSMVLHYAHVRRLRCTDKITKGLLERNVNRIGISYINENKLDGVKMLFKERYSRDMFVIFIRSPQPELGRTEINIEYFPAGVMDEMLQYSHCSRIARFAATMMEEKHASLITTSHASVAYRTTQGFYQADVEVQHSY